MWNNILENNMPYIKQVERTKFKVSVEDAVHWIITGNETPYIKGEYFGYFVNRVAKRFLNDPSYTGESFNSYSFNESKKKALAAAADKASSMLNGADPINGAGDFNYVVTAVMWGIMGESEDAEPARYGMRAYLEGIIDKIYNSVEVPSTGSQRDSTMAFRRHLVIRGVLLHILKETYRRPTAYYEDEKRFENRDIWELGKLVVPEEAE
jgi:hypothetical protein